MSEPLPWVQTWVPPASGQQWRALDVACGSGRHTKLLMSRGYAVAAVDRKPVLDHIAPHDNLEIVRADLETGSWPLGDRQFDVVVVTNYLHRPLFPPLLASLAPNGRVIYQTFARGHEAFARPRNPAFLLEPGELWQIMRNAGLHVAKYEQRYTEPPGVVQRIVAHRQRSGMP